MDHNTDDIGAIAEEALCEAFNEAGIPYNSQALTKIAMIVERWAKLNILADGNLDVGDYK